MISIRGPLVIVGVLSIASAAGAQTGLPNPYDPGSQFVEVIYNLGVGSPAFGGYAQSYTRLQHAPAKTEAYARLSGHAQFGGGDFEVARAEVGSEVTAGISRNYTRVSAFQNLITLYYVNKPVGWQWRAGSQLFPSKSLSYTFMVGSVPVTLSASAFAYWSANVALGVAPLSGVGLHGSFRTAGLATGLASVNLGFVQVGLSGSVTFFNQALNADFSFSWLFGGMIKGLATYHAVPISAALRVFFSVRVLWWSYTWYSPPILQWSLGDVDIILIQIQIP